MYKNKGLTCVFYRYWFLHPGRKVRWEVLNTHPSTAALGCTLMHTKNTHILALTIKTHLKQELKKNVLAQVSLF